MSRQARGLALIGLALAGVVAAGAAYLRPRLPALGPGPPPAASRVCDASFVDDRHGALVLCSTGEPRESVFVTFDAGRTWRLVPATGLTMAHVAWFGARDAVLEGYLSRGVGIWVTADGGLTWSARSAAPPPTLPYTDSLPEFVDPGHGIHLWYLDSAAALDSRSPHPLQFWRTDDGARTWQRVEAGGLPPGGLKELLLFTSPTTGFLGLSATGGPAWPRLFATADGAADWQPVALGTPPYPPERLAGEGMLRAGPLLVLWMQDVESDRLQLFTSVSSDGGRTWSGLEPGPTSVDSRPAADADGVLYLQDVGGLWRSRDGGRDWAVTAIPAPRGTGALSLVTPARGALFAVGDRDTLLRSRGAGTTWERLTLPRMP